MAPGANQHERKMNRGFGPRSEARSYTQAEIAWFVIQPIGPMRDDVGRVQRPFHPVRQGPEVAREALPAFPLLCCT
jgi:hypothetical protein